MITPDIIRLSPNFNDAPVSGRTVIIHSTRSGKSMNPTEWFGTLNYMMTLDTVSSHFVISRRGEIARVVPDDKQARHAAEDNDNTWGIELEQGSELDGFTQIQLNTLVRVCKEVYMANFAVPPVHARLSSEPGFIGHQETAQGRRSGKSDPGVLFPWVWFIEELKRRGDEESMIRHNATAGSFSGREPVEDEQITLVDVRSDFGLPLEANWIRLEPVLESGTIRVHDGVAPEGSYAGQVAASGTYQQLDVDISDNRLTIFCLGQVRFGLLGCVGYGTQPLVG